MHEPDPRHQQPDPAVPSDAPRAPAPPSSKDADPHREDRLLRTAEILIATTMIFMGFLQVFVSLTSGSEIGGVFPLMLYFGGIAVWAHATVENPTVKYSVMAGAVVFGLAFLHYGEVLFWHKLLVFWGTIITVAFFMFKGTKLPDYRP